eukprot:UN08424
MSLSRLDPPLVLKFRLELLGEERASPRKVMRMETPSIVASFKSSTASRAS